MGYVRAAQARAVDIPQNLEILGWKLLNAKGPSIYCDTYRSSRMAVGRFWGSSLKLSATRGCSIDDGVFVFIALISGAAALYRGGRETMSVTPKTCIAFYGDIPTELQTSDNTSIVQINSTDVQPSRTDYLINARKCPAIPLLVNLVNSIFATELDSTSASSVYIDKAASNLVTACIFEGEDSEKRVDLFTKAAALIEANYTRLDFGVDELARLLKVSRKTLYRGFMKSSTTPAELIRRMRIDKYLELREKTNASDVILARKAGFGSPRSLYRNLNNKKDK